MEEVQSWFANDYNNSVFSQSPSLSSSAATSTSHETHSAPILCEEGTSFNSLESNNNNFPIIPNPSVSHFCIASFKTITPQISCLAVQNNYLYAASIKEVNVFDLTTLSLVETFGSGSGSVKSITFSNDKIFTSHQDCKIKVWHQVITTSSSSKQKHQLISTLPTFKDRLFNCMFAKNYEQIRRHKQKLRIEHADAVSGLAVNNDAGLMYSVSWDKSFKIWKISSDIHCMESIRAHSDAVNAVVFNPLDGTIYTGSADGQIKVWTRSADDRKKHILKTTLAKHESSVNALALTGDGMLLCSGGGDKVIFVWENNSENNGHLVFGGGLKGHLGAVLCLVCVNGVLISGSSDRSLRIWKPGKDFGGCCLAVLEGHCKPVKALVAIPGGDNLDDDLSVFSGSLDGEIRAWKVVVSDDSD